MSVELHNIEELLARRPALDKYKSNYDKIERCVSMLNMYDKRLRNALRLLEMEQDGLSVKKEIATFIVEVEAFLKGIDER